MKSEPKSLLALQNEVTVLRNLNSPSIVEVKGFYETEKSFYLITKYVEGKTLRNLIET